MFYVSPITTTNKILIEEQKKKESKLINTKKKSMKEKVSKEGKEGPTNTLRLKKTKSRQNNNSNFFPIKIT